MKRLEILTALALVAFATFVGAEVRDAGRPSEHGLQTVTSTGGNVTRIARSVARAAATVSGLDPVMESDAAPGRDLEQIRRMLRLNGVGTYINEVLVARDSSLTRWP